MTFAVVRMGALTTKVKERVEQEKKKDGLYYSAYGWLTHRAQPG